MVVAGKISVRDEKAPQLIANQVWPIAEYSQQTQSAASVKSEKLYLKLPSETGREYRRVRPVLNMFLGKVPVVLYFEDTRLRRQTHCQPEPELLQELREILGEKNVVLK